MYSKKSVNVLFYQELKLLNEHCYTAQSGGFDTFTQIREKEREKKRKKKKDCWETCLFDVFLLA